MEFYHHALCFDEKVFCSLWLKVELEGACKIID